MNKDTIELHRTPKHWYNYGLLGGHPYTLDSQSTLDALVEWTQGWTRPSNIHIYKHLLRVEQERIGVDGETDRGSFGKIPYCDLVYYLDIYWQ